MNVSGTVEEATTMKMRYSAFAVIVAALMGMQAGCGDDTTTGSGGSGAAGGSPGGEAEFGDSAGTSTEATRPAAAAKTG